MKRPWQIWSAYLAALVIVAMSVAGLSVRAWQSDRAESETRAQALVEENVRLALWRMDSLMAPFVAQESARTHEAYQAVNWNVAPGKTGTAAKPQAIPSPLLVAPPPEVLGNFDLRPSGEIVSPQVPGEDVRKFVVPQILSEEQITDNGILIQGLGKRLNYGELLAELPAPAVQETVLVWPLQSQNAPANGLFSNGQAPDFNQEQRGSGQLIPPQDDSQQKQVAQQRTRGYNEFQARSQYLSQNNTAAINNNRGNPEIADVTKDVRVAMMRPIVAGGELLLARQVIVGEETRIQGCWLNWGAIQTQLISAVNDLLPDAKLELVKEIPEEGPARMMASLPVRLVPGALVSSLPGGLSPVRLSLVIAWGAMCLAAVAVAVLLRGVVSLSERRADFVSAVTHELRTPLTTFRMYAEMLSEGMVADEAAKRSYLDTLRIEADRLTHLVENVLAYARLERGGLGNRVRSVSGSELLAMSTARAKDRARQAGLELRVDVAEAAGNAMVQADPSAVEQIVFNLVDNAAKYAAAATDRTLDVRAEIADGRFLLRVSDHGPGIPVDVRRRLFEPFHKSANEAAQTAPGVGLGLALSRRLARDMGGELELDGAAATGAMFVLWLRLT